MGCLASLVELLHVQRRHFLIKIPKFQNKKTCIALTTKEDLSTTPGEDPEAAAATMSSNASSLSSSVAAACSTGAKRPTIVISYKKARTSAWIHCAHQHEYIAHISMNTSAEVACHRRERTLLGYPQPPPTPRPVHPSSVLELTENEVDGAGGGGGELTELSHWPSRSCCKSSCVMDPEPRGSNSLNTCSANTRVPCSSDQINCAPRTRMPGRGRRRTNDPPKKKITKLLLTEYRYLLNLVRSLLGLFEILVWV